MKINLFSLLIMIISLFLNIDSVYADDTEIYFKRNFLEKNRAKTNILFLLDNSSRMKTKPPNQHSSAGGKAQLVQPFTESYFAKQIIATLVMDPNFDYNVGIVTFPSNTTNNYSEMLYPFRDLGSYTKGEDTCIDKSKDTGKKCSKIQWYKTLDTPFSDADYTPSYENGASWGILNSNVIVNNESLALTDHKNSVIGLRFTYMGLQAISADSSSAEKSGLYSAVLEGVFDKDFAGGSVKIYINPGLYTAPFDPLIVTESGFNAGERGFNAGSYKTDSKYIVCDIPKKIAGEMFECDVRSLLYDKLKQKQVTSNRKVTMWSPTNAVTFLITPQSINNDFSIYALEGDITKAARLKIIASPDLKAAGASNTRKELANAVIALKESSNYKIPTVPAYFEAVRFLSNIQKRGSKGPFHFTYTWNGQPQDSPFTDDCQTTSIVLVTDGEANINNAEQDIMNYMGQDQCPDRQYFTDFYPRYGERCLASLAKWGNKNSQTNLVGNNILSNAFWLEHGVASTGLPHYTPFLKAFVNAGLGVMLSSEQLYTYLRTTDAQYLVDELTAVIGENINYMGGQVVNSDANRYDQRKEIYYTMVKPGLQAQWAGNLKRYGLKYIDFGKKKRPMLVDLYSQPALTKQDGKYSFSLGITSWWSKITSQNPIGIDGNEVKKGGVADNLDDGAVSVKQPSDQNKRKMFVFKDKKLIPYKAYNNEVTSDDFAITDVATDATDYRFKMIKDSTLNLWDFGHSKMAFAFYDKCLIGKADTAPVDCDSKTATGKDKFLDKGLKQIIFVGNADGFFMGFNSVTGEEQFSVAPLDMLPNMTKVYDPVVVNGVLSPREKYLVKSGGKPYGLDGDIVIVHDDVNKDGYINNGERALAVVSAGRGGRAIYAFDISNWNTTPKIQWEITNKSAKFAELGYTWSTPVFGKIKISQELTDVLIFGGGYDPEEDNTKNPKADSMGRAIYIVNAWTGEEIWSFSQGMHYSIPSPVAVVTDKNNDNVITDIFAGDMGGQLWRFHIDNEQSLPSNLVMPMGESGVVASIATGDSSESERRRIYQSPSVYKFDDPKNKNKISVNVGTGYLGHPLVTDNQDGFYSFKFPLDVSRGDANKKLTVSDLAQITSGYDNLKENQNYSNGFYIEFASKGEKIISPVMTDLGVLAFNTYIPNTKRKLSCMPNEDQQHSYLIDAMTGKTLFGSLYRTTDITGMPVPVNLYCEESYCTVVFGSEDLLEKADTLNTNQVISRKKGERKEWVKVSWTDMFSM